MFAILNQNYVSCNKNTKFLGIKNFIFGSFLKWVGGLNWGRILNNHKLQTYKGSKPRLKPSTNLVISI